MQAFYYFYGSLQNSTMNRATFLLLLAAFTCVFADETTEEYSIVCRSCDPSLPACNPKSKQCLSNCSTFARCRYPICYMFFSVRDGELSKGEAGCWEILSGSHEVEHLLPLPETCNGQYSNFKGQESYSCLCYGLNDCNNVIYLESGTTTAPSFIPSLLPGNIALNSSTDDEEDSADTTTEYIVTTKHFLNYSVPLLPGNTKTTDSEENGIGVQMTVVVLVIASLAFLAILLLVIFAIYFLKSRGLSLGRRSNKGTRSNRTESSSIEITSETDARGSRDQAVVMSELKRSESRDRLLDIELEGCIGRGRYGEVRRGTLTAGDDDSQRTVAVKIFRKDAFRWWTQETEFYTQYFSRYQHEFILEFIKSEERPLSNQLWLVTAFQENGNLQEYLQANVINWADLCSLGSSLISGLAFLHADVYGPEYAPKIPVAHRDLKSSNMLVTSERTCVVSDFGLSLKLDPNASIEELANTGQVGTTRYMAPELLECKVNLCNTESFKQADVYAVALVLWELGTRCSVSGEVQDYQQPYNEFFDDNPTIKNMRETLLKHHHRPTIPSSWKSHKGMKLLGTMIEESWENEAECRLTAAGLEARFEELHGLYEDSVFDDEVSEFTELFSDSDVPKIPDSISLSLSFDTSHDSADYYLYRKGRGLRISECSAANVTTI